MKLDHIEKICQIYSEGGAGTIPLPTHDIQKFLNVIKAVQEFEKQMDGSSLVQITSNFSPVYMALRDLEE